MSGNSDTSLGGLKKTPTVPAVQFFPDRVAVKEKAPTIPMAFEGGTVNSSPPEKFKVIGSDGSHIGNVIIPAGANLEAV